MPTVIEYHHLSEDEYQRIRDLFISEGKPRGRLITAGYSHSHQLARFVFTNVDEVLADWLAEKKLHPDSVYKLQEFPQSEI